MSSSDSPESVRPAKSRKSKDTEETEDNHAEDGADNDAEDGADNDAEDGADIETKTSDMGTDTQVDSREARDKEIVNSLSKRYLHWTSEDLFDTNLGYAATVRGILNIVEIIVGLLIMTLIGIACQYPQSTKVTFFYCHSSVAFTFVITCSACIQSLLFFACCMVSKKADLIIFSSPLELVYYVVFASFFCIAGLTLEANLSNTTDGYDIVMAGGVFAITESVLFFMSALWFCIYHKTRKDAVKRYKNWKSSSDTDREYSDTGRKYSDVEQ